ncbi:MAG: hypothetical protein NW220_15690 [Leptolyngbyaceae cyanobacterium bins.349]|nr:hypothetical protein [Leptolyngbyaceae cyanobacterium bins.349]
MSEPGSVHGSWSIEDSQRLEWADPVDSAATKSLARQLKLDLGTPMTKADHHSSDASDPDETSDLSLSDYDSAYDSASFPAAETAEWVDDHTIWPPVDPSEVENLRSLVQKQVDRIHNLEQALDQSLTSLEELRVQLVDQQFLENQLAATEEIANIQQCAITQLKQQLSQQQQALAAQQAQTQEQATSFQNLLDVMEGLAEGQQTRLAQLKLRIHNDPSDRDSNSSPLASQSSVGLTPFAISPDKESQQTTAATEQITELKRQLRDRQRVIEQLETELARAHEELQDQQALITTLQPTAPSAPPRDTSLDQELFAAHCKIQDLETQISKQITTQAILQHTCEELEQARDRYQTRATELESQFADMQEQILKQAQQASEYETAVQHWKDRYVKSQDYLKRMKDLVEQSTLPPTPDLLELIMAIQTMMDIPDPESVPTGTPRTTKMDIPEFLARRHRYRVRP